MFDFQKIKSDKNKKRVGLLFLLWFLTMPFGSHIGSISMGFLTIYPNLILTIILFILTVFTFFSWRKSIKIYSIILFLLLIYSVIWGILNELNSEWKFDFRSVMLQFLYATNIFGMFYLLGKERFLSNLKRGVIFFLLILVVTGILEYYTGIHIAGFYTEKLTSISVVSNVFYTPVFLYDNPNTYLTYLISLSVIFIGISYFHKTNRWFIVSLFLLSLLFSISADSRIGMFLSILIIAWQVVLLIKESSKKWLKNDVVILFFGFFVLSIIVIKTPLFIGPKYIGERWEDRFEKTEVIDHVENETIQSSTARINLIKNGIDFIKENPLIGIGPGQYKKRSLEGSVNHEIGTVINPHNYVIELISQYGILGWSYFLCLIAVFFYQIKKCIKTKSNYWLLILLPVFGIISLLPSAFLCLDINWIFIPIVFLLTFEKLEQDKNVGE